MTRAGALGVAAVIAAMAGGIGLLAGSLGLQRTHDVVEGTPVEIVWARDETARRPGVVVVHGFSGSRQLMSSLAATLARNGYVVALLDLPGHGRNQSRLRLPRGRGARSPFENPISAAIERLHAHPAVDPARTALAGHSMGAGAAIAFAHQHRHIGATVAISGSSGPRGPTEPDDPKNTLLMVGALEFAAFRQGALVGLTSAYPDAVAGRTYGDPSRGTARRVEIVPGVEHVGVIFSPTTHRRVVAWLDEAFGVARGAGPVVVDRRMVWVLVCYAGAILGFAALVRVLFQPTERRAGSPHTPAGWPLVAGLVIAAPVIAALVMRAVPTGWVPLLAGDYLVGYFGLTGVALALGLRVARRPLIGTMPSASITWRTLLLATYALATFGLVAHLSWLNFSLGGDRWWIAALIFPCWLVYFLADEAVWLGRAGWRRAAWCVAARLVAFVVLVAAVVVGGAPFFVLLLVPVLVPLFVWHGVYAHWLARHAPGTLPAAIVSSLVFAWATAAAFPLG